ncbi:VanW family protein [Brevibacillus humidisoli]|uniref:VanW family protein n=1 Tax=Brevibacillus humidisoli TaxID=2895522 RepID=UPI001E4CD83B|nr:VanW family protein [Brevibacillus humidisoli]UFJ40008.1 VanW family protein [Brevibacillus humidisoli]
MIWPKQTKRSRIRLAVGKSVYTKLRYLRWLRWRKRFAREFADVQTFPVIVFEHRTPLLRRLKDVDMKLQYNKIINLRLASEKLNGLLLRPGQLFSYWRAIGRPTQAKGYAEGMVLEHGRYKAGIGGGLCQLSNLLYWMVLHTPLTVVERWRHSYDVFPDANRTQPFGSGATCFYNYIDLMFQNDTEWTWCLEIELDDTHLIGRWRADRPVPYRYEIVEKEHQFIPNPFGGYIRYNQIYRNVYEGERFVREELVTENQAIMMYEPLLGDAQTED